MKNSSILLLGFIFFSCTNDFKDLGQVLTTSIEKEVPSIFDKKEKAAVFNTSFSYKKYFVSGLMVIKSISVDTFRIVFTAKTGQTLLDAELNPEIFLVNKVISQLDRKILLNVLEKDLRLICESMKGKAVFFEKKQTKQAVYRFKKGKEYRYFYNNKANSQLDRIIRGTKRKKKVIVELENYKSSFPEKINFVHQNFELKIELKLIQ